MSEEKLICGCGGETKHHNVGHWVADEKSYSWWFFCPKCKFNTYLPEYATEAEAIAAFRKATRADIYEETVNKDCADNAALKARIKELERSGKNDTTKKA